MVSKTVKKLNKVSTKLVKLETDMVKNDSYLAKYKGFNNIFSKLTVCFSGLAMLYLPSYFDSVNTFLSTNLSPKLMFVYWLFALCLMSVGYLVNSNFHILKTINPKPHFLYFKNFRQKFKNERLLNKKERLIKNFGSIEDLSSLSAISTNEVMMEAITNLEDFKSVSKELKSFEIYSDTFEVFIADELNKLKLIGICTELQQIPLNINTAKESGDSAYILSLCKESEKIVATVEFLKGLHNSIKTMTQDDSKVIQLDSVIDLNTGVLNTISELTIRLSEYKAGLIDRCGVKMSTESLEDKIKIAEKVF